MAVFVRVWQLKNNKWSVPDKWIFKVLRLLGFRKVCEEVDHSRQV